MHKWRSEKSIVYNRLSSEFAMKSQVLHTIWRNISGEAAGEILSWSLLGVKGFKLMEVVSSCALTDEKT